MVGKSPYVGMTFDIKDNDILYLLGVYFGDGSIRHRSGNYEFSLGTIDIELVEHISNIIYKYTNVKPKITSKVEVKTLFHRISFSRKPLLEWMHKVSLGKEVLPKYIYELSNEKIKFFLAGYFDCDGYVSERKRKDVKNEKSKNMNWCAGFNSVSDWASDIRYLLNKVNIKTGSFKKRESYLNGERKKDRYDCSILMKSFSENRLPLIVKRKNQRIDNYINYESTYNPQRLHALHPYG